MPPIRKALYDWMSGVIDERGWSAASWARQAEVTPTNLTRFLRDPETASLPSAETIGRLAWAAGEEPRFLGLPQETSGTRVPVLDLAGLRALQLLGQRQAEEFLDEARRNNGPGVFYDRQASRRAFALRVTSLHMNAGGLVPNDIVVLEPADLVPPQRGNLVVTSEGEHICAYRWHPPLLVPASTDPKCEPAQCDEVSIIGVAIHLVRTLRH
jgi:SOS-response transcriptional repressor LexA